MAYFTPNNGLFVVFVGDSTRLITGSADQSAKIWDVRTGVPLFTFNFDSPARSVDFSVGDKLAVMTTDPFMGLPSAIHIKHIARDPEDREWFTSLCIFYAYVTLIYILGRVFFFFF